jgi:acyl-CoA synthetase (AMP-forming)/AMP-acid ligase II/acyl carrier protein
MISQKPAITYGGALDEEIHALATLPEALARVVQQGGENGITYLQPDGSEITQSYRDLCEEAERILAGLRASGLQAGDKVILQVEENHLYLPTFWACVLGGLIAVPMSVAPDYEQPGVVTARFQKAWELCERPIVIASTRVASALYALAPALGMESIRIETLDTLCSQFSTPEERRWQPCQPDDVFMLLFTSGSTGIPKGVMLTHRNILSMLRGYTHLEGVKKREVSFNWMPLDHVGGLVTFHLRDVCLGYRQIHASPQTILQDPLSWLDWLDHYRATRTWAPNFAFSLINEHLSTSTEKRWDLSELNYILNAGEAIVSKTTRRFLKLLAPYGLCSTAIHPSWGMSETSSGATFSSRFALETTSDEDRFVDVGAAIPTIWIRVVDMQAHVLEEGQSGQIQVKGPTVTSGYYRNPELNEEAFTPDGWFDTGDVGFLQAGRLTITGRTKNIIIINGLNYYCHEIEAVVEEVPGVEVTYTGACAVRDATANTDELAIFYCTQLTDERAIGEQWQEIRRRVVSAVGINPSYLLPLAKEAVPKTETGKIQRSKLKQQFEAGVFDTVRINMERLLAHVVKAANDVQTDESKTQIEIERKLVRIWQRVLGIEEIDIHDNFFDLGGDSLVNIRMVALAHSVGLQITPNHISNHQTIAGLVEALSNASNNED